MSDDRFVYQARMKKNSGARRENEWLNRTKDQYDDLMLHLDAVDVRVLVEYSRNEQRSEPNG
jgi:hypothetical protein